MRKYLALILRIFGPDRVWILVLTCHTLRWHANPMQCLYRNREAYFFYMAVLSLSISMTVMQGRSPQQQQTLTPETR